MKKIPSFLKFLALGPDFREPIPRYVDLMSDFGFKAVFGKESNKDLLIDLLKVVLPELHIQDLTYRDKERVGFWHKAKKSTFDVACLTQDGEDIIIEIQVKPQKDFADRVLYYASYEVLGQKMTGDEKYTLKPIYSVSFLDFCLSESHKNDPQMVWNYKLIETHRGDLMTQALNFTFVEIHKFKKSVAELCGDEDNYYFCLRNMNTLSSRPGIFSSEKLKKLFVQAEMATMTLPQLRRRALAHKEKRDLWNQIEYAKEEGELGTMKRIAKNLLRQNLPTKAIIEATGLTEEEVKVLSED